MKTPKDPAPLPIGRPPSTGRLPCPLLDAPTHTVLSPVGHIFTGEPLRPAEHGPLFDPSRSFLLTHLPFYSSRSTTPIYIPITHLTPL